MKRLQRKIVNNLFLKFYPDARDIFRETDILRIEDVYRLRVGLFMYRVVVLDEIQSLRNNLHLVQPTHSYGTRNSNNLELPFPRVEAIRMNFRYQFVNIWNSIPTEIKASPTSKAFKKAFT